jgi:hypothetical protein
MVLPRGVRGVLLVVALLLALLLALSAAGLAQTGLPPEAAAALLKAYPDFLDRVEGNDLVWKDGTRMRIDNGKGTGKGTGKETRSFETMLEDPDIKDMFLMKYPVGETKLAPGINVDPGRARYLPLFRKMYGDCRTAGIAKNLADVTWLPGKDGSKLRFSKVNGAAEALQTISNELARLPDRFLVYLRPSQGTYSCRAIAGTNRQSAHGFGIAIDIAAAHSDYWRRAKPGAGGHIAYKNEIPWEIVRIFEAHGFIWGGKWYHYDTMHFEYRPELVGGAK